MVFFHLYNNLLIFYVMKGGGMAQADKKALINRGQSEWVCLYEVLFFVTIICTVQGSIHLVYNGNKYD